MKRLTQRWLSNQRQDSIHKAAFSRGLCKLNNEF